MIAAVLVVLAVLAYLGRSLVMLTSVGGIAAALWLTRRRAVRVQLAALWIGAIGASLIAEVVHLLYHAAVGDAPGHGGFWVSALLVGGINAVAILPVLWVQALRRRRAQHGGPPDGG